MGSSASKPATSAARWSAARPFAVLGSASVVAGGLVAAVTAPAGLERGSWVAAYLVLVTGVAQIALGAGQAHLAPAPPSRAVVVAEFAAWNVGSAAVVTGTLVGAIPVVDLGGALLVGALALVVVTVRGSRIGRWWLRLYWLLVAVLLISVPVGLLLARL